jgi:hypothetical protein
MNVVVEVDVVGWAVVLVAGSAVVLVVGSAVVLVVGPDVVLVVGAAVVVAAATQWPWTSVPWTPKTQLFVQQSLLLRQGRPVGRQSAASALRRPIAARRPPPTAPASRPRTARRVVVPAIARVRLSNRLSSTVNPPSLARPRARLPYRRCPYLLSRGSGLHAPLRAVSFANSTPIRAMEMSRPHTPSLSSDIGRRIQDFRKPLA